MKKVGILTINDYTNYGNRLQNYAAQEVITSLGFKVVTLVHNRQNQVTVKNSLKYKVNKMINLSNTEKITLLKSKYNNFRYKRLRQKKIINFKDFTNKFITESHFSISKRNIQQEDIKEFDYFVTGSDQVWNPTFGFGTGIDFLEFAPLEKRIAYAPSFGISKLPHENMEFFKEQISKMNWLSVREEAGAAIIKELTGRESKVIVDPTLMLTKAEWLSVSEASPVKPAKKYLLTYFLGGQSKQRYKEITKIATEKNLKIVNLADLGNMKYYTVNPSEFIDFINSAEIFCTDSFHGVVFSIILEKPFIIFDREGNGPKMNSRIETLLKKFQLESRSWNNNKNKKDIFTIDFTHIPPILESERLKALNYLTEALK